MTTSHSEIERLALDQIEPQLVRRGYRLVRNPSKAELPSFIEGYVPDAIAIGQNPNIALEIKGNHVGNGEGSLARIRKLFEHRDDWIFQVYHFSPSEPLLTTLGADRIDDEIEKVRMLAKAHGRAAFVLAWSVLEASVRELGLLDDRPRGPNQVIGLLASEGYIKGQAVPEFLDLANMRNRIVHGQLDTEPSIENVERILTLAQSIRSPDEAGPPH